MRASCKLASAILEELSAILCPGITTKEVDRWGAKLMAEAGCKSAFLGYRRFPGHICISVNDEVVHGIGGSRRIQYGDVVKLDIGVVLGRFRRRHRGYNPGWAGERRCAATFKRDRGGTQQGNRKCP